MATKQIWTALVMAGSMLISTTPVGAQAPAFRSNMAPNEAHQTGPFGISPRNADAIVGSWLETVTVTGGPTFKSLVTYNDDGDRISSDQGSVITEPPFPHVFSDAHGPWAHKAGRVYTATFLQLISDLNGGFLFVNKARQTMTLGPSRNSYRAVWTAEFVDAAGVIVATFEGTAEGQRIKNEPLP